jgi:pyruvate/2-oxoglutarate dehydrogenase complex dihydrolipoamide dehydrogenase (E3) component
VITGKAVFVDPHTVGVDDLTITADTILINTGSEPIIPDIPGLRLSKYVRTSTELIESTTLPPRLAIVVGGYLGIEFSFDQRFGSRVTMFEAAPRILRREDDVAAAAAERILADEVVEIIAGADIVEILDGDGEATVVYERAGQRHTVRVDAILAAAGRKPATGGLGLEAAGVRVTDRGAVEVDEHLRTSQPHIFALGDVNGGPQFTYISLDDSRIVLDALLGDGRRTTTDRVAVPHTLFMTPPLATVGLTKREARATGRQVNFAKQPVAEIVAMPRAYAVEETRGLMKFVLDDETDEILGAALLSVDAQELINTVALAHGARHHGRRSSGRDLHAPQFHRGVQRHARRDRRGMTNGFPYGCYQRWLSPLAMDCRGKRLNPVSHSATTDWRRQCLTGATSASTRTWPSTAPTTASSPCVSRPRAARSSSPARPTKTCPRPSRKSRRTSATRR